MGLPREGRTPADHAQRKSHPTPRESTRDKKPLRWRLGLLEYETRAISFAHKCRECTAKKATRKMLLVWTTFPNGGDHRKRSYPLPRTWGTDSPSNRQLLHGHCHDQKTNTW